MATSAEGKVAAVIVAAGRGTRAGASDVPKQFRPIGGETMLRRTMGLFAGATGSDEVQT
jgi:2-C-methyl-D-erythritol 4-phosphate cytidylyltransferase/2-C-methyl-D-erythritol 2,4-cyclodiphosphate synthase